MYYAGVYSAMEAQMLDSLRMFLLNIAAAVDGKSTLTRWVENQMPDASDEVRPPLRLNVTTLAYFTNSTR